ncbi:hypothetical protein F7725_007619 [Dissostichus mawsoni]|uniref:Uncharacterized protein n=1 Tax=Dissostichus mawsoni TaxID=36200 RepID=A0A7J5Y4W4_DISMA|nr:hypothetical protein F7725_007619 [Dissostichus mawsoni]
MELFLRDMRPHVQPALANTASVEPRALAEEADRFFLAARRFTPEAAPSLVEARRLAEAPGPTTSTNGYRLAANGRRQRLSANG